MINRTKVNWGVEDRDKFVSSHKTREHKHFSEYSICGLAMMQMFGQEDMWGFLFGKWRHRFLLYPPYLM